MNCRQCGWELNLHPTIGFVWCVNPHCIAFDRPSINPAARVIPEKLDADQLAAGPLILPSLGTATGE